MPRARIDPKTKLTALQQAFADEYVIDFNGLQAYKRAQARIAKSPSDDNIAQAAASRLLSYTIVRDAVEQAKQAMAESVSIDRDWVMRAALSTHIEAKAAKQYGPATQCLTLLGKATGGFGDRPDGEQVHNIKVSIERVDSRTAPIDTNDNTSPDSP